jgi:hypothetical protein
VLPARVERMLEDVAAASRLVKAGDEAHGFLSTRTGVDRC